MAFIFAGFLKMLEGEKLLAWTLVVE